MSDDLVGNMSKAKREVKKPGTTKSYLWIETADGSITQVEQKVAILCQTIYTEMLSGCGSSKKNPISLPPSIKRVLLSLVLDYCQYHSVSDGSYKERKYVDKKFLDVDAKILCELMYVADYLQMKPLIDRTCEAMIKKIESASSPEEFYHMLNHNDVLTMEEKLSRIKLLNRLIKEKRKEEEERENVQVRNHEDTRSIDDLLAFIDGGNGDSKEVRTSKKKKKNRKKKDGQKNAPSTCASSSSNKASILKKVSESHDQDSNASDAANHGIKSTCSSSTMVVDKLKLSDTRDESFTFEDDFGDGDFDPSLSEELDREVEDFARRINIDQLVRMQEIYTSSQESRLLPVSIEEKGSKMKGLGHDYK